VGSAADGFAWAVAPSQGRHLSAEKKRGGRKEAGGIGFSVSAISHACSVFGKGDEKGGKEKKKSPRSSALDRDQRPGVDTCTGRVGGGRKGKRGVKEERGPRAHERRAPRASTAVAIHSNPLRPPKRRGKKRGGKKRGHEKAIAGSGIPKSRRSPSR